MDDHYPSASRLLRDATDDLAVDVDRIVRGGVSRGRAARRRRRAGTALAAAAVVGVIGVAASVGPDLLGSDGDGVPVAADSGPATSTPSAPSATVSIEPSPARRTLAVTQAEVADAFATIFPGDVSEHPQKEVRDDAPIVDFVWEGFGVRVGLTPEDYVTGEPVGTPMERCELWGQEDGSPCLTLPDGTVVQTMTSTGPRADGRITSSSAWAWTPDGWDVMVAAHNAAASKDSPVLDDVPPFTEEQLLRAATSDVWFSGS
ncbi:hypothetical protein [Nocardioides sp.]|uniref:hypothetical protein n=1 Tax=Nocardioides sp. TaxID=35761 RepID=UPI00271E20E3|nr:hypothetical protein [Nocardioides sp.]MDO9454688.1 hypothetical protein [Nocardioides sp.]